MESAKEAAAKEVAAKEDAAGGGMEVENGGLRGHYGSIYRGIGSRIARLSAGDGVSASPYSLSTSSHTYPGRSPGYDHRIRTPSGRLAECVFRRFGAQGLELLGDFSSRSLVKGSTC